MTLSYNIGLTGGSMVAYVLDAMLGPKNSPSCNNKPIRDFGLTVTTTAAAAVATTTTTKLPTTLPIITTIATMVTHPVTEIFTNITTALPLNTTVPTLMSLALNSTTTGSQ